MDHVEAVDAAVAMLEDPDRVAAEVAEDSLGWDFVDDLEAVTSNCKIFMGTGIFSEGVDVRQMESKLDKLPVGKFMSKLEGKVGTKLTLSATSFASSSPPTLISCPCTYQQLQTAPISRKS
jgi:hypothetical protein